MARPALRRKLRLESMRNREVFQRTKGSSRIFVALRQQRYAGAMERKRNRRACVRRDLLNSEPENPQPTILVDGGRDMPTAPTAGSEKQKHNTIIQKQISEFTGFIRSMLMVVP